ncbi:MAG TPA: hypothetical protein VFC73_03870 [Syntrophomonadaceae bacterium]|nr:hypothetical protein [Syntrophomonadaceae bacterium]
MLTSTIVQLGLIFLLNAISTGLGTLKSFFLSRQIIKPVYFTTFLDALIFAYAFKLIVNSSGFIFVLAFALGRTAGVLLGSLIDKKLAVGLLETTVYKHPGEGIALADRLRAKGYSVTTMMGHGIEGKDRLLLNIISPRKDFPELKELLLMEGKVNMSIKGVTKVSGKVGNISIPSTKKAS